jgi:hypothetical protein
VIQIKTAFETMILKINLGSRCFNTQSIINIIKMPDKMFSEKYMLKNTKLK